MSERKPPVPEQRRYDYGTAPPASFKIQKSGAHEFSAEAARLRTITEAARMRDYPQFEPKPLSPRQARIARRRGG